MVRVVNQLPGVPFVARGAAENKVDPAPGLARAFRFGRTGVPSVSTTPVDISSARGCVRGSAAQGVSFRLLLDSDRAPTTS